jgi:hypothetical protein
MLNVTLGWNRSVVEVTEEDVVKFLYPLLPKVYVSAADKRANPKVQTVALPFCQSTVQTGLYTAYEKLRHEVNVRGIEGRVQNPLRFFQDRVSTATSPGDISLEEQEETKTPIKRTHTFSTSSRKSGKNKRSRRFIED